MSVLVHVCVCPTLTLSPQRNSTLQTTHRISSTNVAIRHSGRQPARALHASKRGSQTQPDSIHSQSMGPIAHACAHAHTNHSCCSKHTHACTLGQAEAWPLNRESPTHVLQEGLQELLVQLLPLVLLWPSALVTALGWACLHLRAVCSSRRVGGWWCGSPFSQCPSAQH